MRRVRVRASERATGEVDELRGARRAREMVLRIEDHVVMSPDLPGDREFGRLLAPPAPGGAGIDQERIVGEERDVRERGTGREG